MTQILNVTNGDCAVAVMQQAGIDGDFLPWRDFLYEGPVLKTPDLKQCSQLRVNFIAETLGDFSPGREVIVKQFAQRDNTLLSAGGFDKIRLWFEHDLYDQLQLLQILASMPPQWIASRKVYLINTAEYLGELSAHKLARLQHQQMVVTTEQLALAQRAWQAYCSETPQDWQQLQTQSIEALPFLRSAIVRSLQLYPHYPHGLCRVAFESLKLLATQGVNQEALFAKYQTTEDARFLTDRSFATILAPLIKGGYIIQTDDHLTLSASGLAVVNNQESTLKQISIDRWVGGVHLTNNRLWLWHPHKARLIAGTELPEN